MMMATTHARASNPQKSHLRCHFPPTCFSDGTGNDGLIAEEEEEAGAGAALGSERVNGNCSQQLPSRFK